MNWKLIVQLSLFGLAMAIATVFWISSTIEPICWLVIFLICAYLIARKCSGKYFLHGFLVSMCNSVWVTGFHVAFHDTYVANHPMMQQKNASMPLADMPRLMMVISGPFFGAAFGLLLGLFAFVASKFVKKTSP